MSGVLHVRFAEAEGIQPSDALGNLSDLGVESGIVAPARVAAWTGAGRQFRQAAMTGLVAADQAGNGTLLQRDATIQVLVSLSLVGASGPQTIVARGTSDGTIAERYAYGLELEEQAQFRGLVDVRWFWQDSSGVTRTQPAGTFRSPGEGAEFVLTATRRWESTSRVVVRYYVGDVLIAELESSDGDISGGTTGHTTIGARKESGVYGRHLNGVIDELLVTDEELSAEEIRHTWTRLVEHQPGGVETFGELSPPGSSWATNPGSDIGRRVKIGGELLGLGVAAIDEIRELLLPDAASAEQLARWERICELSAGPGDSLDVRRARVASFLARDQGYQLAPVREMLASPMDLEADQVQILEFTNTITDDFSSGIARERWLDGGGLRWVPIGGELRAVGAEGSDLRWESGTKPFLLTTYEPGRFFVSCKLSSFALFGVGAFAGMMIHNRATNDSLWFGLVNDGGTIKLAYRLALDYGAPSAFVALATPESAFPVWLRIATPPQRGATDDGAIVLSYSSVGPDRGFTDASIHPGPSRAWSWAGFCVTSSAAALPSVMVINFDDFLLDSGDGLRPYLWYAYRDPSLAGTPDMVGAERLVQKIKPAYTHAAAIMSTSLRCDDERDGLCDRGPMGAL